MSIRHISTAVVVGLCSVLFAVAGFAQDDRISVRGNRIFIQVDVNGDVTEAILDSGAEMSVFDRDFALRAGVLTVDGGDAKGRGSGAEEVDVQFAQGVNLESAGVELADMTVAVVDLAEVMERLLGRRVDLILGRDLFDATRLQIDIEKGLIRQLDRSVSPEGVRLDLVAQHGVETIPVTVEGHAPTRAEFDLGNGTDVLIGAAYAQEIGLLAEDRIIGKESGGGIGGAIERDIVIVRQLEIAGVPFHDVRAAIDTSDKAGDVNVGVSILRHFLITTDFSERAVWLATRSD